MEVAFSVGDSAVRDVAARVDDREGELISGRDPLAVFVPLLALRIVLDGKAGPVEGTDVLLESVELASGSLLENEEKARAFTFRESDEFFSRYDSMSEDERYELGIRFQSDWHEAFYRGYPRLDRDLAEVDQRYRAKLSVGRGGFFVKSKAPRNYPEVFAPYAVLLLIEHVAKGRPYEDVVVPMAAGLTVLWSLASRVPLDELQTATAVHALSAPVSEAVLSPKPRELAGRAQAH